MPGALLCCPQPPPPSPQGHRWESYWCSQSAAASTILSTALLSTILYTPLLSTTARYSIHCLQSHPSDQISRSCREASLSPDHCYCSSIFCLPTYSMPQGSTEVKMGNKLDNINLQSIHMRQRKSRLFNISGRNKDISFFHVVNVGSQQTASRYPSAFNWKGPCQTVFLLFGDFLGCLLLHWYGPCVYPLSKPLLSVLQTSDCCRLKAQVDLFFILKSSLLTQHLSLPKPLAKARTKFIGSYSCSHCEA